MKNSGFTAECIDNETLEILNGIYKNTKRDILTMTTLAKSGHPGGALSSVQIFLVLYYFGLVANENNSNDRDRIVISHGHTSAGAYSVLGRLGYFDIDEAISTFRLPGSMFEGHIERDIPGIDWSTGNLGQGLSAGCGFALAARLHKTNKNVFVVMGDGEQQKGQISEARRFAAKYKLNNLVALIDYNKLQLTGSLDDIMPQDIVANYESDGWNVVTIDGHDFNEIYKALGKSLSESEKPTCIICKTIMGKGLPAIEDDYNYHGAPISDAMYEEASSVMGFSNEMERYKELREKFVPAEKHMPDDPKLPKAVLGNPITYGPDKLTDNRSAYGTVLKELAEASVACDNPIASVFDCDLASSVKTAGFAAVSPDTFFQAGIQEHNTATMAGALSTTGIITFFSGFGVFGVDETYNQERLNDINYTNIKLVTTHVGVDVGEDGKTHQCIDYVALMRNLFHFKIMVPADPNQTDRIVRWMINEPGNAYMALGRSKIPAVTDSQGEPFFGGDYCFEYGKADIVREGTDAAVIAMGTVLEKAVEASDKLKKEGISLMVINMSCPGQPDTAAIAKAVSTGNIVTYEDHSYKSGLGTAVLEVMAENQMCAKVVRMGFRNYSASGSAKLLFSFNNMDVDDVVENVKKMLAS